MRRLLLIAVLLLPSRAFAWNPHGHRVVAHLAYRQLSPAAKARVAALLKLHPSYPRWIAGAAPAERDEAAFLRASNWADDIRDDPSVADADKHKDWHYVNRPYSIDGTATRPPPLPNAEVQIGVLRRQLADRTRAPADRAYALVWLLHLVGDVHQPLHAIARFDRGLPGGDRGGTLILLAADPPDNLHLSWDRALGDFPDLGHARAVNGALPGADPAPTDEHRWIDESYEAAKQFVYGPPILAGPGPFTITPGYAEQMRAICRTRVLRAGARLARLVDDALK